MWDIRHIKQPVCTGTLCGGGGVWRMAWHPEKADTLLAACMHGGFAVIGPGLEISLKYGSAAGPGQHGSLAYGVAWCQLEETGCYGAVTCSFYDRSVHVWDMPAWIERDSHLDVLNLRQ